MFYRQVALLLLCSFAFIPDGTKTEFLFKNADLKIVDFHLMKSSYIKEESIYLGSQTIVKDWFKCYSKCLDLIEPCMSFNFKYLAPEQYLCQPSAVKPHLDSAKVLNGVAAQEVWYMPDPKL